MNDIISKLPNVGTTIFTKMSNLANQHGAVNLAQGFPNFTPDQKLLDLVTYHLNQGANQYAPMPGHTLLRGLLCEHLSILYGRDFDRDEEITITAGGTQALFCAFAAFVKPNDEVILIEPCYDSYAPSIELLGGRVVSYQLTAPHFRIDWEAVAQLITQKTRMICINSPGNPTGKMLTAEDMSSLARIVKNTDVLILSDEVYEHLTFDGRSHESVLKKRNTPYQDLYERSLAVFSFGKSLHATGWKIGYIVCPKYLMREFRKVHQFNVFSAHHPTQAAIADYIGGSAGWWQTLSPLYQTKRDLFLRATATTRFKPLECEGSYFQLFDYSDIAPDVPDTVFADWLTQTHKVASIPVSVFYQKPPEGQRLIRLCFAKTEEVLLDAAQRLQSV